MRTPIAPVVLFDLDGTLVDSASDLLEAMNRLLAEESRPLQTLHGFRQVVSKGARAMLALSYPDLDEADREDRLAPFLEHYAKCIVVKSTVYQGMPEVLDAIEAAGSRWGIVTNKPGHLAREVVQRMGWSGRCAVLVAGDTLPTRKPHPGTLLHACASLGASPDDCVYVGDDERDVHAAQAAGIASVAVLWGYRAEDVDPAAWGPDRLVALPAELLHGNVLAPRRNRPAG